MRQSGTMVIRVVTSRPCRSGLGGTTWKKVPHRRRGMSCDHAHVYGIELEEFGVRC
jgi:hypothetical protein